MLLVYAVMGFFIILLMPSEALAWGPGMHVEVALNAIEHVTIIAPFIAELIKRFPEAFIYGAASPDIIVGKKYAGYLHHCHNWRIGHLILNEAKTDRQKASAYGYLMHLAADIVAHNYYIPVKIVRSWSRRLLTHTYWEMRFDLGVRDEAWDCLDAITELDVEEFDKVLERVLRKTLFSFSTNKRIFNTILMLQKMHGLRASLRLYAARSTFGIGEENRQHYMDLAMESALDFLKDPINAACLKVDPAGLARLSYAKNLRRNMRGMVRRDIITEEQAEKLVELVKERLALGLYRPDMQLPVVMDVL
ncbi:MAG: zinc dependent phospholipase C family protein [Pseudomonadota bacterium]